MQEPSSKNKKGLYRLRRADSHERLSARLRHFSFGAAVVFVVAAAGIVIHSLYNIQIKNGATFRQYAAQQQLLDSTIQATRGEIYDTSGITLASTSVVWTIWADPSYSTALFTSSKNDDTGEVTRTADPAALQEVSTQITLRLLSGDGESLDSVDTFSAAYQTQYQAVYDALSKSDSAYQTLATKVNNAIKLSIEQYVTAYNKAHKKADADKGIRKGRISVSSTKSFQRDYPYGAFAAAVLGFCDADGYGTYGLEKSYESTLAGVNGRTITLRNAYGNAIADENATTYAAKDGSNLVLSLDVNIQEVAERYLNEAISANNVENRGAAIVMNVKTGAILAMASKPDFDPNNALDYTANEAYLNELVHAEPELYGIYLKNEDGIAVDGHRLDAGGRLSRCSRVAHGEGVRTGISIDVILDDVAFAVRQSFHNRGFRVPLKHMTAHSAELLLIAPVAGNVFGVLFGHFRGGVPRTAFLTGPDVAAVPVCPAQFMATGTFLAVQLQPADHSAVIAGIRRAQPLQVHAPVFVGDEKLRRGTPVPFILSLAETPLPPGRAQPHGLPVRGSDFDVIFASQAKLRIEQCRRPA